MTDGTTHREPEQIVHDFVAWINGDSSKRDGVSESVDVYNPGLPEGEVHSRAEWEAYQRDVKRGFPDFHVEIDDLVAGDDVVMYEVTITGTHEGEFKGIPPTGREVEIHAMSKFLVGDGQVTEFHSYYDTAELQRQLGLTFPDVIGQLPKLARGKLRATR